MIIKKIHYCWFGKGEKPSIFKKCYKSWVKYFPDYEIIEWNEENFDITSNNYIREAYEQKKYAFVSDYARLKILYEEGGIYFDTDVEVLKRIPDNILEKGYFAKETDNYIATGLGFCVQPQNNIVKYMLEDYENIHFINNKEMDLTPCPKRNTESLIKRGYVIDKYNYYLDEIKVYDKEYFCGYDVYTNHYMITENTYTVHHYCASWVPAKQKMQNILRRIISKILGHKIYDKLRTIKKKIR